MQKIFGNKIEVEKLYETNALGTKEYKHKVKVLDIGHLVKDENIKVGDVLLVAGETEMFGVTWITEGQIIKWC
jgi:hypothetical protein